AKESVLPHSSTVSFLSYWRGLQIRPDKAPSREHFDPTHLKSLMPQMVMLSTTSAGLTDQQGVNHSFRVAGDYLYGLHGIELKNKAFTTLFHSRFTDTVLTALVLARRREQALILTVSAPWIVQNQNMTPDEAYLFQNETLRFEICLCPVTNAYGKVDRMVGIYQNLNALSQNAPGKLGRYKLEATRLYEPERMDNAPAVVVRPTRLQLVAVEGRRIA
ncbi:MAG: PAS domain-containing protein, partial [Asticcacaulis sp.]